ncbi:MAG TPA: tRNA 4-thiouridine(8) synthase ThiI, partial [archaeon]|nr:tRNA 4-thiouridine(8) synthase ThiI [archaeon]
VASYLVMKRGCRCEFLHFYAGRNGEEVMGSKINEIVKNLNKYARSSLIHTIPYHNFALEHVPDKLDVILFRRFMVRIAEKIAIQNNCKAIVLGDAIGQVASQTLENIANLEGIISLPILRPLLTYDKNDIIKVAKEIETYDMSIKEYKDCCSIISRRPSTAASLEKIKEAEASIDMEKLVGKTLEQEEKFIIKQDETKKVQAQ